jgi:hypothetical protein
MIESYPKTLIPPSARLPIVCSPIDPWEVNASDHFANYNNE